LDTLLYLYKETNVWLEITTLLIPGENDSIEEIDAMTKWIFKNLGPKVPLHFSAFHPAYKMMDYPQTPLETLEKARHIALKNGLYYVYTGNVYDPEGSKTYCHACSKCVITRSGYGILKNELKEGGHCKFCNALCAGVFLKD